MTIFRCNNPQAVFNKRSAQLKERALESGMKITEWETEGFNCFHAITEQKVLLKGSGLFSECGACVNNNPQTWFCIPGTGRIEKSSFLPKR